MKERRRILRLRAGLKEGDKHKVSFWMGSERSRGCMGPKKYEISIMVSADFVWKQSSIFPWPIEYNYN